MSWVILAIQLLKWINGLISWAKERELITEGRRQEIAEQAMAIAAKVRTRDQIMEQVNAMSEDQVDAGLHGLEPK